jgi:hypothetical protein
MKTFSIRTSSGGTERIEADGFLVASDGILTLTTVDQQFVIATVAMYADKCWQSIKEVK